jgi:hypothetical protein
MTSKIAGMVLIYWTILKQWWNGERKNIFYLTTLSIPTCGVGERWMSRGQWWNDDDRRKTAHSGEIPSQGQLCPQKKKKPHGLYWERTRTSVVTGRRLTPLCHGTICAEALGQFLQRPVSLWDHPNVKQVTYTGIHKSQSPGRPDGRISYGNS